MLPPRRALCCCRLWSRFWICAVANAWLGLASGNVPRFACCLRFAKPRYTEWILRWQLRLTFHKFHLLRDAICLRVYLASISLRLRWNSWWNSTLLRLYSHYIIGHKPFWFLFVRNYPSGLPLGLQHWNIPLWRRCFPPGFHQKPSTSTCATCVFPLWRRCFLLWFHQSPLLDHCAIKSCCWDVLFGFVVLMAFLCTFLLHFNDEHHHTVLMAIASLTPLLSWLKGAPPGTYPSSHQQKKIERRRL